MSKLGLYIALTLRHGLRPVAQGEILAVEKAEFLVAFFFKSNQLSLGFSLTVIVLVGVGGEGILLPDKIEFALLVRHLPVVFLTDQAFRLPVGRGIPALGLEAQIGDPCLHSLPLDTPLTTVTVQLHLPGLDIRGGFCRLMCIQCQVSGLACNIIDPRGSLKYIATHLSEGFTRGIEIQVKGIPQTFPEICHYSGNPF